MRQLIVSERPNPMAGSPASFPQLFSRSQTGFSDPFVKKIPFANFDHFAVKSSLRFAVRFVRFLGQINSVSKLNSPLAQHPAP